MKAPKGWEVKKLKSNEGSMLFYTPDIKGKNQNGLVIPPLTEGCGIEASIIYKKMDFNEIKETIQKIHLGLHMVSDNFKEVVINKRNALKNIFKSKVLGSAMSIYIPKKNMVYDFDLYWSPNNRENCEREFNKFLSTVSIK